MVCTIMTQETTNIDNTKTKIIIMLTMSKLRLDNNKINSDNIT